MPFARALALLSAFTPQDEWLGNGELVARTGLARATVTRLAQALVAQGYLHHAPSERKYKLALRVLSLGYGAICNSPIRWAASAPLQAFADECQLDVNISSRDRLDIVVLASHRGAGAQVPVPVHVGMRWGIATSAIGWALLAVLPDAEREYLGGCIERRTPREWQRHRRRVGQAIEQVHEDGYCFTVAAQFPEIVVVAAPLMADGHPPHVLTAVDATARVTRARVTRELGPRLRELATCIARTVARP